MEITKSFLNFSIAASLVFIIFFMMLVGTTIVCFNRKSGSCPMDMQKIQEIRLKKELKTDN